MISGKIKGTWTTEIRNVGMGPGTVPAPPAHTYSKGKAISLFTGEAIPADWIRAQAQQGKMGSALYAVALKTAHGLQFRAPLKTDFDALAAAETQLGQWRGDWEARNLIPTEARVRGVTDRYFAYGATMWTDFFSPRQLLAFGVLMEELTVLRSSIIDEDGGPLGEAAIHLLAFALDKLTNHNCIMSRFDVTRGAIKGQTDRHDFGFKPAPSEMATAHNGGGLAWAIDNVCDAFEEIAKLAKASNAVPVEVAQGSATSLIHLADKSVDAVVVDPPYSDNVQYSELADFFYVWLKRT